MITEEELNHLATLSKLKLTDEEKEKYLNNMEDIIQFLDQLHVDEKDINIKEEKLNTFTDSESFEDPKKLLENSTHKK